MRPDMNTCMMKPHLSNMIPIAPMQSSSPKRQTIPTSTSVLVHLMKLLAPRQCPKAFQFHHRWDSCQSQWLLDDTFDDLLHVCTSIQLFEFVITLFRNHGALGYKCAFSGPHNVVH